jgi:SHAQKYF class myb-like DNA-binding protein
MNIDSERISIHKNDPDITLTDSNLSVISNTVDQDEKFFNQGRWTTDEHINFIQALLIHGNDWRRVQQTICTRSTTQARSHAQKFFIRIKKKIFNKDDENKLTQSQIFYFIRRYVKREIMEKLLQDPERRKILEGMDEKLSKVLLSMMTDRKFTISSQEEDLDTLLSNSKTKKGKIFKISKIKKQRSPMINNQVINQGNNYINILTINVMNKNEEDKNVYNFQINNIVNNNFPIFVEDYDKNNSTFDINFDKFLGKKDDDFNNFDFNLFSQN